MDFFAGILKLSIRNSRHLTLALLKAAGDYPARPGGLGMVPRCVTAGEGLGEDIASNLDALVQMILEELRGVGVELRSTD